MLPGTDGAYNQLLVVEAGFQYGAHWDFELMKSVNFLVGDGEFFFFFASLLYLFIRGTSKPSFLEYGGGRGNPAFDVQFF